MLSLKVVRKVAGFAVCLLWTAFSLPAFAHAQPTAPRDLVHAIAEFKFESGQVLRDMKVGYVLHGKLNQAKDNAILLNHGANGDRKSYASYIGPGKLYDTDKYFVIAVDAIGGGNSSSPKDGLGPDFPRYGIRDVMRAEYDLVTRGLGLTQMRVVQGGSMGAQIALEWGINYPDFVRGLVLHAASARTNNQIKVVVDAMVSAIKLDPKFNGGRYTENPVAGLRVAGMIYFPWVISDERLEAFKTKEEYQNAINVIPSVYANWDANGLISRYAASREHDVSKPFDGDMKAALPRVKAKVLVMASATDRTLPAYLAREVADGIPNAIYVEVPSNRGHFAFFQNNEQTPEYIFVTDRTRAFLESLAQ